MEPDFEGNSVMFWSVNKMMIVDLYIGLCQLWRFSTIDQMIFSKHTK